MTNLETTTPDLSQTGGRRRRFRPLAKAALATVVAMLGVGVFAAPAFAHSNAVTGVAACPVGATQTITWTITNDYNGAETAGTFVTSASGATFNVSSVAIKASPTTSNESTGTVIETLPATATGTVSFTETATWPGPPPPAVTQTVTGNVTLGSGCTAPAIGVVKTDSPGTVVAGSPTHVVYTLAVNNSGQEPTTSTVNVSDVIPAGLTYVPNSVSCGTTPSCTPGESNGTVTWSIVAPIYGGVTDDLTFAVTANAGDPSETINNTGLFTGPGCTPKAPATTCSTSPVPLIVTNTAAVIVVKTASTGNVTAGQSTPVTYTVTVSNPAPAYSTTTAAVAVSDVIPSGLTYVAGSVSCGLLSTTGTLTTPSCIPTYTASSNTVTYLFGAGIAAGASFPVTFQATVNAGDTSSITNTATWTGPGCTPAAPATSCTTSVTITVANFTVSKSDSAGSSLVNPGQVVTYTLAATNTGTGPGSITVNDAAPTGTTLSSPAPACPANTAGSCSVAVTGSSIAWTISSLAAGATDDLTFTVTVNAGTGGTHILNTGVYTEPGCTTAGGCTTNTTDNPVPPPTSPSTPTTTTTTTTTSPVTKVSAGTTPTAIKGASTVHTGEPWAGSTPYVLTALAFGISLLSLGTLVRRRRAARVPTA
jgi:fimbrial isopeptide formation D2 family protein/uncharacterized repeat protein (TIGR01451 family)